MIVYLNGEFCPLEDAKISVMDRGFIFGDAVYEVIPVYDRKPFRLEQHLIRLQKSLDSIFLPIKLDFSHWKNIFETLIEKNEGQDFSLYLQISRGTQWTRRHRIPDDIEPTFFARVTPLEPPSLEKLRAGITAITVKDARWDFCHIKSTALLTNILMDHFAVVENVDEAILIRDGFALEATAANLFIVKNNILITPPLTAQILGGITREVILEIAKKCHVHYEERMITETELMAADEIWISSSTSEIRPVISLNGIKIGTGKAGDVWEKIYPHYGTLKKGVA